jgi:hypothetical protein
MPQFRLLRPMGLGCPNWTERWRPPADALRVLVTFQTAPLLWEIRTFCLSLIYRSNVEDFAS